jgi:hypothetical protein
MHRWISLYAIGRDQNFCSHIKNSHIKRPRMTLNWGIRYDEVHMHAKCGKLDAKIVVIADRWSLFGGGR